MHVILTGATGLVGCGVLNQLLKSSMINKVSILSRRPVPMAEGHTKANVIIHNDFNTYNEEVLANLKGAEGCIFALGISVNAVSKAEYHQITVDYPLAAAKAFASLSDPFKFVYVSGEGATTSPGMFTPRFARLKGEAEGLLLEMSKGAQPSLRVYNVRPGVVDPHKDTDIHDFTPTHGGIQGYVESLLWPAVGALPSSMHSPTDELGRAFIKLVTGDGEPKEGKGVSGEGRTFANVALKRIAAS